MNALTFNGNTLTTINQNDQVWLTSADVAKALGYKSTRSLTNLYNANSDEFSPSMTEVIESVTSSKTKGLRVKTRIFSLRGCHLLAMFARTKIAKAFRVWVLDILERETKTTASQRTPLRKACDRLAVGNMLISDAYKLVSNHFGVDHIDQIPESKLPEAVAFVYDMILTKQSSRQANQDYIDDMYRLGMDRVNKTHHAIEIVQKSMVSIECAMKSLGCATEVIKTHNATQANVFESIKSETARLVK